MPVTSKEFFKFAESNLNQKSPTEMDFRNSTSRAYYALYHHIKSVLKSRKIDVSLYKGGSHQALINILLDSKETRKFGYIMQNARVSRNMADYDIEDEFNGLAEFKTLKAFYEKTIDEFK